jgi:hypothetical protein
VVTQAVPLRAAGPRHECRGIPGMNAGASDCEGDAENCKLANREAPASPGLAHSAAAEI